MRVLTWNINGVRTLPQYHPWNALKTFDDILNHLEADVMCFQEMKSSRPTLPKQVALPPSFDSFFSFPVRKTGYSGTAIYTRRMNAIPLKAEEGLTGLLQPVKPPLTSSEKVSKPGTYPPDRDALLQHGEDEEEIDYTSLDSEGRAVVVDLGLFVLISVYCPNDGTGTPERDSFKMAYHRLLSARVAGLIEEGRQVMVVGDLNACASIEDHCEGRLMVEKGLKEGLEGEEGFWGREHRRWLRDWLIKEDGTGGCMVDIVRKFWPDRKGMYTCWNTKISARETNYGTRIDFILITPGLVPWIKAADIQPQIKGSDHCPVFVDMHDEITNLDGSTTKLVDVLGARPSPDGLPAEPPRMAAKYWDEHKQKLLSNFFGKGKKEKSANALSPTPPLEISVSQSSQDSSSTTNTRTPGPMIFDATAQASPHTQMLTPTPPQPPSSQPLLSSQPTAKRKLVPESPDVKAFKKSKQNTNVGLTKKPEKGKGGQSTIASFFSQPKASGSTTKSRSGTATSSTSTSTSSKRKELGKKKASANASLSDINAVISVDDDNGDGFPATTSNIPSDAPTQPASDDDVVPPNQEQDIEADYRFALLLSQSSEDFTSSQSSSSGKGKNQENKRQAWNNLLAPTQPPKCTVHQEPAKEYTVNKPGPNKGKRFFICSRPVGPGYDKGRSERLREHVDPNWKCDFFKWSSDVRKEMARNGSGNRVS
ncbi:Endonuclease/exonuclease/phosphatase [Gymnopilus junonius]|uniref:DNA-(apurinic or apyrimidinic site) endonuclease 2 n=1 Tax=Gymnopilus junonius TaxID=109634 RepID=A0A9P5TFV1_GYMJU|nr:Endonuclease/exonuclease/phosphatase [Gymnopilus junonius]